MGWAGRRASAEWSAVGHQKLFSGQKGDTVARGWLAGTSQFWEPASARAQAAARNCGRAGMGSCPWVASLELL